MKESMLALVYRGNHEIGLEERPVPKLRDPRDAIVRVTRSTICTSDLHIRDGFVPRAKTGVILGHEFVGEIAEVGLPLSYFSDCSELGLIFRKLIYTIQILALCPLGQKDPPSDRVHRSLHIKE